jgi:hypothetical protein
MCHAAALLLHPHRLEKSAQGAWWATLKHKTKAMLERGAAAVHMGVAFLGGAVLLGAFGYGTTTGRKWMPPLEGVPPFLLSATVGISVVGAFRWNNSWIGWHLWEHLTTAWTKQHVAGALDHLVDHGVSEAKRTEMRRNTLLLQHLDRTIQATSESEVNEKLTRYIQHQTQKSSELYKAGTVMHAHRKAPNTSEPGFRRKMLAACPHILRGHHFLNSLGELRPTQDIITAYLLCYTWMQDGAFAMSQVAVKASLQEARILVRGE